MLSEVRKDGTGGWVRERLFFDGDSYFADVLGGLGAAKRSICVESYIFEADALGERVIAALESAAARGVEVRVIVDAFGSAGCYQRFGARLRKAGVKFRVFHRVPWLGKRKDKLPSLKMLSSLNWLRRLNRRNHRKLIVV